MSILSRQVTTLLTFAGFLANFHFLCIKLLVLGGHSTWPLFRYVWLNSSCLQIFFVASMFRRSQKIGNMWKMKNHPYICARDRNIYRFVCFVVYTSGFLCVGISRNVENHIFCSPFSLCLHFKLQNHFHSVKQFACFSIKPLEVSKPSVCKSILFSTENVLFLGSIIPYSYPTGFYTSSPGHRCRSRPAPTGTGSTAGSRKSTPSRSPTPTSWSSSRTDRSRKCRSGWLPFVAL